MEYTVESSSVVKSGMGAKGPWTIYKLKLVGDVQEPTGFDPVQPGDKVTLSQKQSTGKDGKVYQNLNYDKVTGAQPAAQQPAAQAAPGAAPAAAPAGASDKRVLKLLVAVATQIGMPNEKILEILEGE